MLDFPILSSEPEPPTPRLTLDEYIAFCQFCLDNHFPTTPANRQEQPLGEKDIKEPFRLLTSSKRLSHGNLDPARRKQRKYPRVDA